MGRTQRDQTTGKSDDPPPPAGEVWAAVWARTAAGGVIAGSCDRDGSLFAWRRLHVRGGWDAGIDAAGPGVGSGHPDGESVGGPEHLRCNRRTAAHRARRKRDAQEWASQAQPDDGRDRVRPRRRPPGWHLCDPGTGPPGAAVVRVVLADAERHDSGPDAPVRVGCVLELHRSLGGAWMWRSSIAAPVVM